MEGSSVLLPVAADYITQVFHFFDILDVLYTSGNCSFCTCLLRTDVWYMRPHRGVCGNGAVASLATEGYGKP